MGDSSLGFLWQRIINPSRLTLHFDSDTEESTRRSREKKHQKWNVGIERRRIRSDTGVQESENRLHDYQCHISLHRKNAGTSSLESHEQEDDN